MEILEFETGELLPFAIRVIIAGAGGMLIGFERDVKGKTAGIRTSILVAMGAAVFVLMSLHLGQSPEADYMRVIGQVVSGIGFLGAGAILQNKNKIKGIATAATIWCSAGIGCLAAASLFSQLAVFVILVVIVNITFGIISIGKKKDHFN
ncbi:MgtC/SapB family protein [Costertonia aggregata]|uniref:MgtC/SapB family protein n=1 Tax=Costertonia aggregata TaxID=343403 RepID=A0A7H9AST9_9FLAO|nr:MgtC/SapB family protein [Costertonia aggregata]QLG46509.1 MgtC/SapB family protein [Costertonia aggregata]